MKWWVAPAFAVVLLLVVGFARAAEPEEQLATLSGYMLTLDEVGSGDFVLECGPAEEVVPLMPKSMQFPGDQFCIMTYGTTGQVVIGMYFDESSVESGLDAFSDPAYAAMVQTVKTDACRNIGVGRFEECPSAIKYRSGSSSPTLYVYVHNDLETLGGSGTMYLIASEQRVSSIANQESIFGRIADFFRGLFG
jgi:hypothetical protein